MSAEHITEIQIREALEADGRTCDDYFLWDGMSCFWDEKWGVMAHVIERNELAAACRAFLADRGARQFSSYREILQAFGRDTQTP
jgi:hypothetical protein